MTIINHTVCKVNKSTNGLINFRKNWYVFFFFFNFTPRGDEKHIDVYVDEFFSLRYVQKCGMST